MKLFDTSCNSLFYDLTVFHTNQHTSNFVKYHMKTTKTCFCSKNNTQKEIEQDTGEDITLFFLCSDCIFVFWDQLSKKSLRLLSNDKKKRAWLIHVVCSQLKDLTFFPLYMVLYIVQI